MNKQLQTPQWRVLLAMLASGFGLLFSASLLAQESDDTAETADATEADAADLGKLEVTGSRIRRLDVEGPSPIVVVSRDDIEARGFGTVYQALENLTQNTGTLQGESYTNSFTPNAESLSLRSLGGGRTLVLLNGRRVADYPQPFNSQSNFFNFATIPAAAIERIEVLTGSASAVYGSDAVAGVINVILRDDVTAPTLTARVGTTADGGGDSELISGVWGKQWDRSSVTMAFEHQGIDPIYGKDRSYLDSVEDAPQIAGFVPFTRSALVLSRFYGSPGPDGSYYDPGEATCEGMQSSGVPYVYAYRPNIGYYCGRDDYGDETIQNERDRNSAYLNYKAEISDSTSFFADLMYWDSSARAENFHMFWSDEVWDPNIVNGEGTNGDIVLVQRVFHPSETGNQGATFDESATNVSLGLEGSFSNFWNWETGVTYSQNEYHERQPRFKEEVADAYFGGSGPPIDVCIPIFGSACGAFRPDYSTAQFTVYDILGQSDIDTVMGTMMIDSDSSVWSTYAQFDGDLMEMKHGPLQFAAIVEFSSQEYDISPDDRLLNREGNGWWGLNGTGGGGDRDRYAAGIEFGVPLTENFKATVAGRYDEYNDNSNVGGAATYGIGLEYRPVDSLLLRSSYNTSFRAPDMHYLFAAPSGFFQTQRDIYQCRQDAIDAGTTYNEINCPLFSLEGSRQGNLDLKEEEGESFTLGFVYSPMHNFSVQVDYFVLELNDAVNDMSTTQLLRDEADCQLGVDTNGNPVDSGSGLCADALSRIARETPLPGDMSVQDIALMTIGPINTAFRKQKGIDAAVEYTLESQDAGDFGFRVDYTHVIQDERKVYDYDPVEKNFRDNLQNFNARSTVNVTTSWAYKKFDGTLFMHRLGSMPNWQETGRLGTWTTFNGSASLQFLDEKLTASLLVRNIGNRRPPKDDGFDTWPFFFRGQYNAVGRELYAQLRYAFE